MSGTTLAGAFRHCRPGREFVTFRFGNGSKQCALTGASMGGIAMRLLRSRARVQVDSDTQVEGQVERAVEIFSRVEGEIRDFVRRDLAAASRHRLEDCSDLTPDNVDSLLQRLSGTTVQEIDHFIAELQALRQRLQHEATRVEREVVQYASLNEAARAVHADHLGKRLFLTGAGRRTSSASASITPQDYRLPRMRG